MEPIHVGLMADPAAPTEVANRMSDLAPPGGGDRNAWDIEVVSEPFTTGCEDVDTAVGRLEGHARQVADAFAPGSATSSSCMQPLLERIERGEMNPTRIITHRLALNEAPRGLNM